MELSERHIKKLEDEGYAFVYEQFDKPNVSYPSHKHETRHSILISEGSMDVTIGGITTRYTSGDRLDISAGTEHAVTTGPEGCKYVIGED